MGDRHGTPSDALGKSELCSRQPDVNHRKVVPYDTDHVQSPNSEEP